MFTHSRFAAVAGGVALSLSAAAGIASADPDMGPVINTTCTYPQAVSALNATNPAAADQFNASPVAQGWLTNFLAAPHDQRQQMIQQVQGAPEAQPFVGAMVQVASSCKNF